MYCPLCDESLARISVERNAPRRVFAALRLRKGLFCHECGGHFSVASRPARLAFVGFFLLPILFIGSTGPARWVDTKWELPPDSSVRQLVRTLYIPIRKAPILGDFVEDWMNYWGELAQVETPAVEDASSFNGSVGRRSDT